MLLDLALSLSVLAVPPSAVPCAGPSVGPRLSGRVAAVTARVDEGDEQYDFLVGLCEKGLHDVAVREARKFLEDHPRHPKADLARYRLATALWDLDRPAEARPHLERLAALRRFEFRAETLYRLGQCRAEAGEHAAAAEAFEAALAEGKDYLEVPATFLLAESRFRAERFAAAHAAYAAVIAHEPAPAPEYARDAAFGLAWSSFRLGEHERAVAEVRAFLAAPGADPEQTAEMRFLAGESLLALARWREALEEYGAVEGGPFADAALRGAGFAWAALAEPARAARAFGALLERFPQSPFRAEAALQKGVALLAADDPEGALAVLAGPDAGRGVEALYARSRAEAALGRHAEALASLDAALAQDTEPAVAARLAIARGEALDALGRHAEAARAFAGAGSDYALHAAAVASLNAGRLAEAIELAERLAREHPRSVYRAQTALVRGEALLARERFSEAERAFAEAVAAGPSERLEPEARARDARARSRIAWCRYLAGDAAAAAEGFAAVARAHPDAPEAEEARYMAARAHADAGDDAAAARAYAEYLERHPDGARRAPALLALGRLAPGEAGRARLAELVDRHPDSPEAEPGLLALADRLYAAGERDAAAARYAQHLERWPASASRLAAAYGLAWCRWDAERFADAAAALAAGLAAPGGDEALRASAFELAVWCARRTGDAAGALAAYRELAARTADEERVLRAARTVARGLQEAGEGRAALGLLTELAGDVRARAVRVAALVEASYLALELADVDLAAALVERGARELGPAEAAARRASARGTRGQGGPDGTDSPGAADARGDSAGEAPDPAAALAEAAFFVGEALWERGEPARAAALYALAAAPASPVADRALYKAGFARLALDDPAGAAESFGALVAAHPESELWGETLFLQGEALFRAGRYADAVAPLERLRAEAPRHEVLPKALFRLGIALGRLERWAEADAALTELLRDHAGFANRAEAELWRGRALAALGRDRAARAAFERVVADGAGVLAARARLELARLDFDAGRTEDALSGFLKVAVLYAHAEEVAEALLLAGGCLEKLGDPERAAEQYAEVLERYSDTTAAPAARRRLDALRR